MKTVQIEEILYTNAIIEGSWKHLVHRPFLLWRWQQKHPDSIKQIAILSSHYLKHHDYCEGLGSPKCKTIAKFQKQNLIENLARLLNEQKKNAAQQTFLERG